MNKQIYLITGCSTGIGKSLCGQAYRNGHTVIATARSERALEQITATYKIILDVTKPESIESAQQQIHDTCGGIDILINNAGYAIRGAMEEVSLTDVRNLFDVNVFGVIRMLQAFLPGMRKAQSGRIITIGSISGRFSQPVNGTYCASKSAVEAIHDALRTELKEFNIESCVIEPGPVKTEFEHKAESASLNLFKNQSSPYSGLYKVHEQMKNSQHEADAAIIAEQILAISGKKHLKARYMVGVPAVSRLLSSAPDAVREHIFSKLYNR